MALEPAGCRPRFMEYQVKPLGKLCTATGQPLVPGSFCHSVLIEGRNGLERQDFSEAGWTGPPPGTIARWKSLVPVPVEVRKKLLDPDTLMSFFDQLTEEANPLQESLRYVLALLLVRKRRLRLDGSRWEGENEILHFTSLNGEGTYEVRDLQLSDAEVRALQETLNAHLAAEWSAA